MWPNDTSVKQRLVRCVFSSRFAHGETDSKLNLMFGTRLRGAWTLVCEYRLLQPQPNHLILSLSADTIIMWAFCCLWAPRGDTYLYCNYAVCTHTCTISAHRCPFNEITNGTFSLGSLHVVHTLRAQTHTERSVCNFHICHQQVRR